MTDSQIVRRSVLEEFQRCDGCDLDHPMSSFTDDSGQTTTRCSRCRAKQRRKARPPSDPIATRRIHLRQKYGITVEDYDALRAEQDYRCAICGIHECDILTARTGRPRNDGQPTAAAARLVVDHCHDSGQVRGLLCGGCNSALGHFRDSPAALLAAMEYIRRNSTCPN